jgi:hypothetical protein
MELEFWSCKRGTPKLYSKMIQNSINSMELSRSTNFWSWGVWQAPLNSEPEFRSGVEFHAKFVKFLFTEKDIFKTTYNEIDTNS